jgi:hypothetical protein
MIDTTHTLGSKDYFQKIATYITIVTIYINNDQIINKKGFDNFTSGL